MSDRIDPEAQRRAREKAQRENNERIKRDYRLRQAKPAPAMRPPQQSSKVISLLDERRRRGKSNKPKGVPPPEGPGSA